VTAFGLSAAAMLALVLALLLPPLRRPRSSGNADARSVNLAIFRERLRELEADREAGTLSASAFDAARADLERELLADLPPQQQLRESRAGRKTLMAVALIVPALTIGVYWQLGGLPNLPAGGAVPSDPETQMAFIRANIESLRERVEADPDVLEPRLVLARAYLLLDRPDRALDVYADTVERFGDQAPILSDYAEAVAATQDGQLKGAPAALLARALAADAAHPKALWLAGLAAAQADDDRMAAAYWRRLLAVLPPESESAAELQEILTEVARRLDRARIPVEVEVDPALAGRLSGDAVVFVLARPTGGGAPLAVTRFPASELPRKVVLDESMAMVPGHTLAQVAEVMIEARISSTGVARPAAGDLLGRTGPLIIENDKPVALRINQVLP
jgi:cytochrome c-type biogenesis protein CcmH